LVVYLKTKDIKTERALWLLLEAIKKKTAEAVFSHGVLSPDKSAFSATFHTMQPA